MFVRLIKDSHVTTLEWLFVEEKGSKIDWLYLLSLKWKRYTTGHNTFVQSTELEKCEGGGYDRVVLPFPHPTKHVLWPCGCSKPRQLMQNVSHVHAVEV